MDPVGRENSDQSLSGSAATTIELVDATARLSEGDIAWVADHLRRALGVLGARGAVSARIVVDDEMAVAHQEFCGVTGTTDVITFDLTDPEDRAAEQKRVEADMLVCLDEAHRQANARGHEPRRELLLYLLHGVLHCLGHDDHDEQGFALMHAEEDRVLSAIGVGATFVQGGRP